ncbi:hypothetical protein ACFLXB_00485 [Chloroflexota bacterium]
MEKNKKKISLTEIGILIVVIVSVLLILVHIADNLKDEINLQSHINTTSIVVQTSHQFVNKIPDGILLRVFPGYSNGM